ncbi:MAG TPA: MBL fold metallo-hydrolase [Thermomicrobiales bacterium]|nr:MBL fold metallo-hydrolase [Thermomicrobiales bacterium]
MAAIMPGLHRVELPLGDNPLGAVNAYLIETADGPALVDTGWWTPEAWAALEDALGALGCRPADLSRIVLTHGHPDHAGMAARLRDLSGAPIALHPRDLFMVAPRRPDQDGARAERLAWLTRHGLPEAEAAALRGASPGMGGRMTPFEPDRALAEGDTLALGAYRFTVLETPGHSPGQVCLYDAERRVLIAADHVLPEISPNVGLMGANGGNPLADYLAALARVRDLPVEVALPGHGAPFADLAGRVDELVAHHDERLAELLAALAPGPAGAYDLCARLTWVGGAVTWAELAPFSRLMALGETLSHLVLLEERGQATREDDGGVIRYRAAGSDGAAG